MNRSLGIALALRGAWAQSSFARAARDPRSTQAAFLRAHLARNRDTAFGREHCFERIRDAREFARRVPVRDYEGHRPWIDRLLSGERGVLTRADPLMFATTSGTTAEPKYVPVTRRWLRELAGLMRLWLYRAHRDHPGLFAGTSVSLVSPVVESRTPAGIPIGSVSGLTYRRAPWLVRRTYAVPYSVAEIADHDHRYLAAARLMLAADVSLLAAPNPSTLLRLAREGRTNAETIVRAVHDGRLGVRVEAARDPSERQRAVYAAVERRLRPDPARARAMGRVLEREGALLPSALWPNLALIGCWLGGSAGVQARRLSASYGDAPLRDLGLRATEGTLTVPFEDGTAAGALALRTGFWEFVPEDAGEEAGPPLLAHELEDGGRYSVLLTTSGGLYRYDIHDLVEVRGFHARCPSLAFLRKGRDMVSLTGEKLHSRQVAEAAERAAEELALPLVEVQLVADEEEMHYDLLVERDGGSGDLGRFAGVFDAALRTLNPEYDHKRASDRLGAPRLVRMRAGWSARRRLRDVTHGMKRDAQYKWPILAAEWDAESRNDVEP